MYTTRIASPRTNMTFWSAMALGFVRKRKAAVRWNKETARMMVNTESKAMTAENQKSFLSIYSSHLLSEEGCTGSGYFPSLDHKF